MIAGACLGLAFGLDSTASLRREQVLEMRAEFAAALTHPNILRVIDEHSVSIFVYEWGSARQQRTILDWTAPGADGIHAAAATILDDTAMFRGATAIGEALLYGYAAWRESGCYDGAVNLVADGFGRTDSYVGIGQEAARAEIGRWFSINVILIAGGHLDELYRTTVIQGAGAFVVHAEGISDFAETVRHKIVLEIAQLTEGRK
jgi:hypothetical protein